MTLDDITDDRDRIATCLPVIQEVLQGFDDERAFRIAQSAMYALPCVEAPLGGPLWPAPSTSLARLKPGTTKTLLARLKPGTTRAGPAKAGRYEDLVTAWT